jgi:hypothetical protein
LIEEHFDVKEEAPHEDEVLMSTPLFDEVIQGSMPPTHEEDNPISYTHFEDFDDAPFYDSKSEQVLEEPLDALDPSCYNESNDVIENIDKFIHIGRRKWDVIYHDRDLFYDIEGHFQLLPPKPPYVIVTNSEAWQCEDDMITDLFQPPRDDFVQHSRDDFQSYRGRFDTYSFENLDLLDEENFQPPLCSNFDEGKDMVGPETLAKLFFGKHVRDIFSVNSPLI